MEREIIKGTNITDRLVLDQTDENFNVYPNIDAKYGPYPSIEVALTTLVKRVRGKGLTVGIIQEDNTINEYWFKSGIEDEDFVEKLVSSDYGDAIEELQNAVFPLEWNSFNPGETLIEKGNSIVPQISWTLRRKGEIVEPDNASVIENGQAVGNVASNKLSWTRAASINQLTRYHVNVSYGSQKLSRAQDYTFYFKKYYGVTHKEVLTSNDVLELQHWNWAVNYRLDANSFDCTGGKYPTYAIPKSIYSSKLEVWVGGFRNSDLVTYDLNVTNPFGVTETYTIIRLKTIQTGVLNIEIK